MKDFPSCFGENGIQVADSSSSKNAQNLVTCVYQCGSKGRSCLISVTWTRSLMGQGLTVGIDDATHQCLCKVDVKPWLFSKRKGSKHLEADSTKIDMFWDLTSAKFGPGPEPLQGFYLSVMFDGELALLLGDSDGEAREKKARSEAVFVAKREHIFGKKLYAAKARFSDEGQTHDVAIECDTGGRSDPSLVIRVDSKQVMSVKRLKWKFRGNNTILVDGAPVEVFWDVHNWLFGNSTMGNAVFMFQSSVSTGKSVFENDRSAARGLGFSLVLYAWKNE